MSELVNVGLTATAKTNDKVIKSLAISDMKASLQNFTWQDYTVFSFMFLICTIVGFYVSLFKAVSSMQDYLVGGRKMQTLPVALSLIASFLSGLTLLGIPTETYVHGIHYIYIISGILLMGLIFERTFLPVLYGLNITSTFEYLELRFDKRTRCFASALFAAETVVWIPIVIYVPALAFNQVTGINISVIVPIVCVVCIIYTCIGGLKAVIWTDVIQIIAMLTAMVLIVSKGTIDVGGCTIVWIRSWESGRLQGPSFNLNPLSRHTFWELLIGGFVVWLQTGAVNQLMMQRYLSLPDFASARRALWIFIIGIIFFLCLCSYIGLLIYATYHKCDPLTTNLVREKDQLLPLLMMDVLSDVPGLPGLFVAGIFSSALSTLSTGLNSMAAIVLEDFYKSYNSSAFSERSTQILMKSTVVIFGTICLAIIFSMDNLDFILKNLMTVSTISNGASLGIFSMGILLPWTTEIGAIVGGLCSLCVITWLHVKVQTEMWGNVYFPEKNISVDGCNYQFTPEESPYVESHLHVNSTAHLKHVDETFTPYGFSYLWYTSLGTLIAITIGLLISFIFNRNDPRDVDPALLAPFIRGLIKPREFPNQPNGNDIIYAYERELAKIPRKETVPRGDNGSHT